MAPKENRNKEPVRRNVIVETTETKALVAQDGLGYDWSDQAEEGPTNFALMAYTSSGSSSSSSSIYRGSYKASLESVEARPDMYKKNELRKKFEKAEKKRDDLKLILEKFGNSSKNLSKLLEIQVSDKFKTGVGFDSQVVDSQVFDSKKNDRYKTSKGYHDVPPPYTGNFMPPKSDLVLADEENTHMTRNKSYLLDNEEIDGGFVAFGGDPKRGRITSKEVGAEADMKNLATTVPVSPIPTTRLYKDHPLEQIIGTVSFQHDIITRRKDDKDVI
ncbi:hypothetical protein Tco_1561123 [Tanacetum coccineum]